MIWADGSRGLRFHHGGKQQVWWLKFTRQPYRSRVNCMWVRPFTLGVHPRDNFLQQDWSHLSLPKQHCRLGASCSSAWDHGEHSSSWPQYFTKTPVPGMGSLLLSYWSGKLQETPRVNRFPLLPLAAHFKKGLGGIELELTWNNSED